MTINIILVANYIPDKFTRDQITGDQLFETNSLDTSQNDDVYRRKFACELTLLGALTKTKLPVLAYIFIFSKPDYTTEIGCRCSSEVEGFKTTTVRF